MINALAPEASTEEVVPKPTQPEKRKFCSAFKSPTNEVATNKASTESRLRKRNEAVPQTTFLLRPVDMVRPSRWVEFQCEGRPNFEGLVGTQIRFAGYISEGPRYEGICYLKHPTKCAREASAKKLVTLLGLGNEGKVVSLTGHPKLCCKVYSKKLVRIGDEPAQGSRSDLADNSDKQEDVKRVRARLTQLFNRILRGTNDPRAAPAMVVLLDVVSNMSGPATSTAT